jgi:hypothetical protein
VRFRAAESLGGAKAVQRDPRASEGLFRGKPTVRPRGRQRRRQGFGERGQMAKADDEAALAGTQFAGGLSIPTPDRQRQRSLVGAERDANRRAG